MTTSIVRSAHSSVFLLLGCSLFIAFCTQVAAETEDPQASVSPAPNRRELIPNRSYSIADEAPSPEADASLDAIRRFANQPDLHVEYQETTTFINSPNADVLVDVYQDDWGASYYVDPARDQVVQFNVGYLLPPLGDTMSQEELRAIADGFYDRELSAYSGATDDLSFEQGSKDLGTHFFRWQSSSGGWRYNPPIFQVGLRADGTLLTYVNTLGYR